jgi:hypothetical protein
LQKVVGTFLIESANAHGATGMEKGGLIIPRMFGVIDVLMSVAWIFEWT